MRRVLVLLVAAVLALPASGQVSKTVEKRLRTIERGEVPITATGSTTARQLRDRFSDAVNVKDFGAKGDGVTDDTAAIQAAITTAGKGLVLAPAGTYKISGSGLSLTGATLRGVGGQFNAYGATVLAYAGTGSAVTIAGNFSRLEDLQIDAPSAATGLLISDANYNRVRNVAVTGNPAIGIRIVSIASGGSFENALENVIVNNAVVALQMEAAAPGWTNGNTVRGALLRTSAASGNVVRLIGAQANMFYDTDASNYGSGAAVSWSVETGSHQNQWYGGYVEGNTSQAFAIFAAVTDSKVWGMVNNAGTPLTLGGGNSNSIFAFAGLASRFQVGNILSLTSALRPATPAWTTQNGALYQGSGAPNNADGNNGDAYFRTDTPANQSQRFYQKTAGSWLASGPTVSADRGDTSQTLTVGTDAQIQRWATTLTANRTVTLSTTGAANGDTFRVVRTGLGAFTLDVGGLRTIAVGTAGWVDVTYNGSAWVLAAWNP